MLNLLNLFSRKYNKYSLSTRLEGHTAAIHTVTISPNGRYLATGGSDGIRFWDLTTNAPMPSPYHTRLMDPVAKAVWILPGDSSPVLCYGTGLGYLVFCQKHSEDDRFEEIKAMRLGNGGEITALASGPSDRVSARIAVGNREKGVQVITFSKTHETRVIFSQMLDGTVPIALGFMDNASLDVYVFGCWGGDLVVLNGQSGNIVSTEKVVDGPMGCVALDARRNQFAIDNAGDGFTLFELDTLKAKRSFPTGIPSKRLPKNVVLGEDGRVLVGGSDHGTVYIFNTASGAPEEILRHAHKGLVQAVTTHHQPGGASIVVSASSAGDDENTVCVWTRPPVEDQVPRSVALKVRLRAIGTFMLKVLNVAIIVLAIVIILDNQGFDVQSYVMRRACTMRDWVTDVAKLDSNITDKTLPLGSPLHFMTEIYTIAEETTAATGKLGHIVTEVVTVTEVVGTPHATLTSKNAPSYAHLTFAMLSQSSQPTQKAINTFILVPGGEDKAPQSEIDTAVEESKN